MGYGSTRVSSAGIKANGNAGSATGDGGAKTGADDDEPSSVGKDNQLFGVLEALLDLR